MQLCTRRYDGSFLLEMGNGLRITRFFELQEIIQLTEKTREAFVCSSDVFAHLIFSPYFVFSLSGALSGLRERNNRNCSVSS